METIDAVKEMLRLQRKQERIWRKAAQEVIKKRPKESNPGGNPNYCILTVPKQTITSIIDKNLERIKQQNSNEVKGKQLTLKK